MPIPFFLVTTKPNKQKIETKIHTDSGNDIDDIHNKILYLMQEHISKFNDLPDSYDDFISKCWYFENSADAEPFEYKIYMDDKWISPWEIEDLYNSVYEILHKLQLLAAYIDDANKDEEGIDDDNEKPLEADNE